MGGPALEVFKFATYVALPLVVMAHYGNPEWYRNNVLPVSLPFLPFKCQRKEEGN